MATPYKRVGPGLLIRGKTYYSDISIPKGVHPKTGKPTYKRLRRALSTNKDIAQTRLGEILETKTAKKYGHAPKDIAWSVWREIYLKERSTQARPTVTITNRTIQEIENFQSIDRLSQITPQFASDLFIDMKTRKRDPLGLYMRNRILQGLKTMMHRAEALGYITPQKWAIVKGDREPKGRLVWFTADDLKKILSVCDGVWETIVLLGCRAGLRRAEMYWLEWSDIDFERNRVHIAPKVEWNPKDYERRYIPTSPDLRKNLLTIQKPKGYVLGEDRPSLDSMTVYLTRLIDKVGLKGGPHTLRHSFGAHLASAGVSMRVIQKLMGHSSVETTEIYAHLSPSSYDEAIERLPPI